MFLFGHLNYQSYTEAECSQRGGESKGSCADGFGVCCTCKQIFLKKNGINTLLCLWEIAYCT